MCATAYTNTLNSHRETAHCIGAFVLSVADTKAPIQLSYPIADTDVAETMTVTPLYLCLAPDRTHRPLGACERLRA